MVDRNLKKSLHLYYKMYYNKNVDKTAFFFILRRWQVMLMAIAGRYRPVARSCVIQTRMQPAERELIERAAQRESMTVSAWVRAVLLENAKAELRGHEQ